MIYGLADTIGTTPIPIGPVLQFEDFDWQGDQQLNIPMEDLIIYELHLRGFTAHPSANVSTPGTFAAAIEKIPFLKELGVNCIELMPIFEFDELDNERVNPETGRQLMNYWGYNPIGFFAPNTAYAASRVPTLGIERAGEGLPSQRH